jgi:hypothetical protein
MKVSSAEFLAWRADDTNAATSSSRRFLSSLLEQTLPVLWNRIDLPTGAVDILGELGMHPTLPYLRRACKATFFFHRVLRYEAHRGYRRPSHP